VLNSKPLAVLMAALCLVPTILAQHSPAPRYIATLITDPKTIPASMATSVEVLVVDTSLSKLTGNLVVTGSLSMPSMEDMSLEAPTVSAGSKRGHYNVRVDFPHPGEYELHLSIRDDSGKTFIVSLTIQANGMGGMNDMAGMQASLGTWSANREGSGTSWQPDSSPMFMKMLPSLGGFEVGAMGIAEAGYVSDGGKRGDQGFFTDSMIMLMGQRPTGGGTLGLDFMTSLDPIFNGEEGVPDLFQTGETARGVPLVDRQHPHNIFSEIAASYSHPLSKDWTAFVYGGPVGEPALGDVMFMHRPSGLEIPEAPITHHWFDSTHISFGVATLGLVYADKWKLDASVFNGHEPGENRYTIDPIELNSASARIFYNPSRDWSFSSSYGYLNSPEALSPGVDQHRFTVSAAYGRELPHGDNFSATAYFGQILNEGNPTPLDGWLAEATYYHAKDAIFARFERVDKDELYGIPLGNYIVNKLVFGDTHTLYRGGGFDYGLGAYAGLYSFPSSLDPFYGSIPVTFGIFLRIRPAKM
jgi:hypothetical protein